MIPTRQPRAETKVEELSGRLRELAFERGPEARLPTIRELCDLFNTSRVTLDEALDVLEAQNILYRKQRSGIFVSPKINRKSICILFNMAVAPDERTSPFWSMLWMLFSKEAQQRAASLNEAHNFQLVTTLDEQENALPEEVMIMLKSRRIHGVLAIGINFRDGDWLAHSSIPVVTYAGYSAHMVSWDNDELLRLAVQSLAQQGCQRIGLWTHEAALQSADSYFRRLLDKRGLQFYPQIPMDLHKFEEMFDRSLSYQEQGYEMVMRTFGQSESVRPDGLIIANDMVADGALVALQELGIRVGEDIKIAAHHNAGSPMLFGRTRNMTIIEFDPAKLVQTMFSILDTLMAGKKPVEKIVLLMPQIRQ